MTTRPELGWILFQTGSTALIYAAYRNHPGVVQVLLEHGADITIHNEDEMTAMDLAVGQGNTAGISWDFNTISKYTELQKRQFMTIKLAVPSGSIKI